MTKEKSLEKIKRLEEELLKKRAALILAKGRIKEKERKAKIKRFMKIGDLAQAANILDIDDEALLGAFLRIEELIKDPNSYQKFKALGQKFIATDKKK